MTTAQWLWEIAAGLQMAMGLAHILGMRYTKFLHPKDPSLIEKMKNTAINIDHNITQWRAWVFFNQCFGLCLFLLGLFSFAIAYKNFEWIQGVSIFSGGMIIGSLVVIYFSVTEKIRKVRSVFILTTALYLLALFL